MFGQEMYIKSLFWNVMSRNVNVGKLDVIGG